MADLLLFCLPYAGGSATRIYRDWAAELPANLAVIPVEPPGRGARMAEPLVTDVAALTRDALGAILPRLDRPYALFGHSLGALVAFELARRLTHLHDRPPHQLFVAGHEAPQLPVTPDTAHELPMPQFRERLRRLAGTPEEVLAHDELLAAVAPIIRADLAAANTYQYRTGPRLSCPITVYGGVSDPEAPPEKLPPWAELTSGHCAVRILPGGHFFLHHEQELLLSDLTDELTAAMGAEPVAAPTGGTR